MGVLSIKKKGPANAKLPEFWPNGPHDLWFHEANERGVVTTAFMLEKFIPWLANTLRVHKQRHNLPADSKVLFIMDAAPGHRNREVLDALKHIANGVAKTTESSSFPLKRPNRAGRNNDLTTRFPAGRRHFHPLCNKE